MFQEEVFEEVLVCEKETVREEIIEEVIEYEYQVIGDQRHCVGQKNVAKTVTVQVRQTLMIAVRAMLLHV